MMGVICHINLARDFRGGEHQTELLIRGLHRMGYRQRLIARKGDMLLQRLQNMPDLECIGIQQPFFPQLAVCRGASVVQVHEAKGGHMACAANSLYGIPYVVTRRIDKRPSNSWANRRLYRNAASVVAVSHAIRNELKNGLVERDVTVIADSHTEFMVDAARAAGIRARFANKFIIGQAAALVDRHKGQKTLIEALRLLSNDAPDLQLLFLGSGPDEAQLRQAARQLDNVSFEGFTHHLGDYLGAMDLFAYPSNFEGLGSVLLDAMYIGLPIVASDVGGIPEIIQSEENGLLVKPGNPRMLADAILRLYKDAALRGRLGERAKVGAVQYSPVDMAGKYAQLYSTIL